MLSVQSGLRGSNDRRVGRKMATLQLIFQSREQVVFRRGQIRRIGWVIKALEAQIGQFLLGCKRPMSRGIVMQEQDFPAPDMLPFSLCNNKRLAIQHMNRPLFPTTLSIPSYDISKYVGLRTYQHPFILFTGCVICEIGTESLHVIYINTHLQILQKLGVNLLGPIFFVRVVVFSVDIA
jgi:hypothetical protein